MRAERRATPDTYAGSQDTSNAACISWRRYFSDPFLTALIDTALNNNQELNITFQELVIAQNEARARKSEYLPYVGLRGVAGLEKPGRYTFQGATEANQEIKPGTEFPEPLPDYQISVFAGWEADIWRKLRNARKAALTRYLASAEGRNFVMTNLISEVANSYYELLALDNQLATVSRNLEILGNALRIVRMEKDAARVTELAVKKFEAEVLNTQALQYAIRQRIVETENRLNFLAGRFPRHVDRNPVDFGNLPDTVNSGIPPQLLANRPDIRRAELNLAASKLDVKVARSRFFPSLSISASAGYQAFNPTFLLKTPESLLYTLAGELAAPLVNRNAIKAAYYSANARQLQAVYDYERTILNAYIEVVNQLSNINNLKSSYEAKAKQVEALNQSVNISNQLFKSARADYMEVLLTQRDALDSKFDLIETKKQQLNAWVNIYRALGGGWK